MDARTVFIILPNITITILLLIMGDTVMHRDSLQKDYFRRTMFYYLMASFFLLSVSLLMIFFTLKSDDLALITITFFLFFAALAFLPRSIAYAYKTAVPSIHKVVITLPLLGTMLVWYFLVSDLPAYTIFTTSGYMLLIFFIILYYLIKSEQNMFKKPMFYLVSVYLGFGITRAIYEIARTSELKQLNPPTYELIFFFMQILIINIIAITIMLEVNSEDLKELKLKNSIISLNYSTIKKLSETDEMTGTYSRSKLDSIIRVLIASNPPDLSILMVDVNDFKSINDSFGHLTGDEVLIQFAAVLQMTVRDTDHVGRWGGDEFIIVLPNTSYENAKVVINKISNNLQEVKTDSGIKLTASIGVSTYKETDSLESLIKRADTHMYMEKNEYKRKNST